MRFETEIGHQYLRVPLRTPRRILMTGNKAIAKLLKLKGLRLRNVVFKDRGKAIYLHVKPYKNGCLCPECERRCKTKRIMPEARTWRDVCVCGWTIYCVPSARVQRTQKNQKKSIGRSSLRFRRQFLGNSMASSQPGYRRDAPRAWPLSKGSRKGSRLRVHRCG